MLIDDGDEAMQDRREIALRVSDEHDPRKRQATVDDQVAEVFVLGHQDPESETIRSCRIRPIVNLHSVAPYLIMGSLTWWRKLRRSGQRRGRPAGCERASTGVFAPLGLNQSDFVDYE